MIELGRGAEAVLSVDGRGVVAATFARAAYLRLPAGLVALTGPGVVSGPLHVRGFFPKLVTGDRATVDGPVLQVGRVAADLSGATVWRGALPTPTQLAASSSLALDVLEDAPPSALAEDERRVREAVEHLRGQWLPGAVQALAGLGPGLTPAGDDVLAGILLLARTWRGEGGEEALVDIARAARTNDVAHAFLAWAARGQSIEPVHRFLNAVAGRDGSAATEALRALSGFGHSSGVDLAFGLRLGFGALVAPAV